MRIQHGRTVIFATLLGTFALTGAAAARFPFQPESRVWLEGTSTVRDFTCKATRLEGTVDPAPGQAGLAIGTLQGAVRGGQVTIPVADLDCGNGTMNGHLRNALRAADHGSIEFRMSSFDVTPGAPGEGTLRLAGTLRIAGQEKPVTIDGVAAAEENGALRVRGSKEIVMTEYGVKPPSLMMGTMKVGPRVKVHFDVVLKP